MRDGLRYDMRFSLASPTVGIAVAHEAFLSNAGITQGPFIFCFLFSLLTCACVHAHALLSRCSRRPERDIRSLYTPVIGSCEPPKVDAGIKLWSFGRAAEASLHPKLSTTALTSQALLL